jgi:hypothetical protein
VTDEAGQERTRTLFRRSRLSLPLAHQLAWLRG